jgi:2-methylcitrate dehydratase PrpD
MLCREGGGCGQNFNLANYVTETRYGDLSPETVEATKKLILDGLAVALGGSSKEGVAELLDCLRDSGGKPESTVWVFGDRMPAGAAAQVNAMMMHALDYDDVYDKAVLHCGVVAIPVALAMAERLGGVSGKDLITAVALGADVCARLSLAVTISVFELGWHYTTLHGNFNAAAAAEAHAFEYR